MNPMQTGLGAVIILNLVLSFLIPNVSIGGHLGGLVGGTLVALALEYVPAIRRSPNLAYAGCVLISAVAVAGAIAVADQKTENLGVALIGLFS
jgi:hypothetical protein